MFCLERMVNYPEGFIMRGDEAATVDAVAPRKASPTRGDVIVLEVTLHLDQVDAIVRRMRESRVDALRFRLEERS
jgi:hypothetical protein